jgi:hypothetical protein
MTNKQQWDAFKQASVVATSALLCAVTLVSPAFAVADTVGRAITGTGKAITGTGRDSQAITGTGRAISGTGRAITGTGKAITGTGRDSQAITGTGRVVLEGAVDSVDQASSTISVLGRKLKASPHFVALIHAAVASGNSVSVSAAGRLKTNGQLSIDNLSTNSSQYIPGASAVTLSGRVSEIDQQLGTLRIGKQTVDYTLALAMGASSLKQGAVVSVRGVQPIRGGILLAQTVRPN